MQGLNRRTVLTGAAALAAAAVVPRAYAKFTAAPVAGGFNLLTGVGGNVLVVSTNAGAVLVDSGAGELAAQMLVPTVGELTGDAKVHTLFNTHWHLEQIGGNLAVGRTGANIVAHEKTRLHLAYAYYLPLEDRYHPPMPVQAQPTESFYTTGEKTVGAQSIEYGYLLEAHTDGDAYVYFRDANVIAVGDAISPERDPELDWFGGGWLGGRLDSLKQLLAMTNAETKFVPSYGPVVGRAEVQREHDVMSVLFDRFHERLRKGESDEDMLAAGIMKDTGRTWNDPARFVHDAHRGFWAHYNTLSHDIV
jgi:glyoxylase-like metal-dependent hydrolase (beta-lactamase superfamily II)